MPKNTGGAGQTSWKKRVFRGAAGLMIAGVCSRLFIAVMEALTGRAVTLDLVMTAVVVLVICAGIVFFVRYFRELGDFDYNPPLGKSPSMPGYFEEHYEGRDLHLNAYGELVPAGGAGDPFKGAERKVEKPLRGAPQAYSAAAVHGNAGGANEGRRQLGRRRFFRSSLTQEACQGRRQAQGARLHKGWSRGRCRG